MLGRLIYVNKSSNESLQSQIRQKIVEGILVGSFAPGTRLPSSRKLSKQLDVSRNTVVIVYQSLIDEGYIESRERSGLFVTEQLEQGRVKHVPLDSVPFKKNHSDHTKRFKGASHFSNQSANPAHWRSFRYPFIDGKFDSSLYPVREWREASARANATTEIYQWSELQAREDDPKLLDEIRTKILPRRGIQASQSEILITSGAQHALSLLTQLLVDNTVNVAVEDPGYPEMRELLQHFKANIVYQPIDEKGIIVDERLAKCDIIYTTPSHQTPTSITMSMARREALLSQASSQESLIIEDDFEFESNFLGQPHPALKSLDTHNCVIYTSCLSKVLASGIQIAFIVADSEIILALKRLRKLLMRNPPFSTQRAVAYFLAMGHYDAYMMQLHKTFFERWLTLREALNIYLPDSINTGPIQGGTAYWIVGPEQLDVNYLSKKAAEEGILIEPVKHYFATQSVPENCFRMGVTSIANERIREGVEKLANLIRQLTNEFDETLSNATGKLLDEKHLQDILPNAVLECQMVYGVPCWITLMPDGTMYGRTGGSEREEDSGQWWLENGMFYRQWNSWVYGEQRGFYVILDGDEMKWFDKDYRFVRQLIMRGHTQAE